MSEAVSSSGSAKKTGSILMDAEPVSITACVRRVWNRNTQGKGGINGATPIIQGRRHWHLSLKISPASSSLSWY